MLMIRTGFAFCAMSTLVCSLACFATAQDATKSLTAADKARAKKHHPVYTVAKYDPKRDANKDLAATIERAKKERKRIILEIGGTW